jgi:hypothetical protein
MNPRFREKELNLATPLRKDQPQVDDDPEITTADLAQPKPPSNTTDVRGPQSVASERNINQSADVAERNLESARPATTPLFPGDELDALRTRWKEVQTAFVDERRKAVEQADQLVASAMKRLAEVFAGERAGLEKQWDRGDNVSTEDLRVALQRYRSFFDRLLAV